MKITDNRRVKGGGKKGLKLNVGMTASNNENTPSLLSDNHSNSNNQVNHVGLATKNSLSSSLADSPMSSSLAGSSASSSPVVQDREPPPPNFSLPSAAVAAAAAAAAAASNSKSTDGLELSFVYSNIAAASEKAQSSSSTRS